MAHEGALEDALRTDIGEYLVVGLVGIEPCRHHAYKPFPEVAVVHLLRAAGDMDPRGKLFDVVVSIPRGKAGHILTHGVVLGVEVALDDDVEVGETQPAASVEGEGAVERVDVAVGELGP